LKFSATELDGVFEIEIEPRTDERGFFARLFCPAEFLRAGLDFTSTQMNLSRNTHARTLRGMHYQEKPHAEAKVVRAVSGALFDVVVDLRPESAARFHWIGRTLDARRGNALFVPIGFAHGFLTLEPETDVLYQMSEPYVSGQARGFRYDDPLVGICWPHLPLVISTADQDWPSL
jgi:dTDP-4-dehydrorhamnose 3,5-epimerase